MKRFGRQANVYRNIIIRIQAKLEPIFGLIVFVVICVFTFGTNTYNRNINNEHIRSNFTAGLATDQNLLQITSKHTQKNRSDFTISDFIDNLSVRNHPIKSSRSMKNIRMAVEKIFMEDTLQPDVDECQYIEITLFWNPNTNGHPKDTNLRNSTINSSYKTPSRSDRQVLWNPAIYDNDVPPDEEYDAGTLFVVIHKQSVSEVTVDNISKKTAQTEMNYTKSEETSPFEFKVCGSNFSNLNVNFFNRENR